MEDWLVDIELFMTLIVGMIIGYILQKYKPFKARLQEQKA
jgi:hypothetical protein